MIVKLPLIMAPGRLLMCKFVIKFAGAFVKPLTQLEYNLYQTTDHFHEHGAAAGVSVVDLS